MIHTFLLTPALSRRSRHASRRLSFSRNIKAGVGFQPWQAALREKLKELLGMSAERQAKDLCWEGVEEVEEGTVRRFSFSPEPEGRVPGYLLVPHQGDGPFPLAVCLQGHSNGMYISLGRARTDGDRLDIKGGRDFARQALKMGYAALVIEQRCFGERTYGDAALDATRCHHAAMNALMTGRTLLGERINDVMSALDLIVPACTEIDPSRLFCMGNSGGGTVSYYAAALDPRLSLSVPSCSVCEYRASIMSIHHCSCNYLPQALNWFEMSDLAGLIAPRPLIVVAGRRDPIFPYEGVLESFSNIKAIYAAAGAPEMCHLVSGNEGHQFYPEQTWPLIRRFLPGSDNSAHLSASPTALSSPRS